MVEDVSGFSDPYISDLVDSRLERPDVEYKAWMDLTSPEVKAKVAKHLCALANHGGGFLIFGISDDGTHTEPHPGNLSTYRQDVLNGIVAHYLQPSFHCSVDNVQSRQTGKAYPVVRVPSHAAQPISARRDGPHLKGSPVGICRGVHYTRAAGPKSVPVDAPDLWREIIHRCVINEREALLGSIGRLFDKPTQLSETPDELQVWHDSILTDWISATEKADWAISLPGYCRSFAFRLLTEQGSLPSAIGLETLRNRAREASTSASDELNNGLAPFEFVEGADLRPKVALFGNVDGYASLALPAKDNYVEFPGMWRLTVDGRGGDVGGYEEDSAWVKSAVEEKSSRRWPPGKKLSPRIQAERAFHLVAFVRSLATSFPDATSCEFAVDFRGLKDRKVEDPWRGNYYTRTYTSAEVSRRVVITSSLAALAGDGTDQAAAQLVAPIFRLFDGWEVHPEYIRSLREEGR